MSKVIDTGDSENLEKSRKNKNLKPYETRNFTKDLENQDEIRNLSLKLQGEGDLPDFRFCDANIHQ